jgi:hypothetical protein
VKQAGYDGLAPEDLIALRSEGVGGELLRRLRRDTRPQSDARPRPKPEPR